MAIALRYYTVNHKKKIRLILLNMFTDYVIYLCLFLRALQTNKNGDFKMTIMKNIF